MRDRIIQAVMQSIITKADTEMDESILYVNLESLSTIAEYAADDILDVVDDYAQRQWDREYRAAHI